MDEKSEDLALMCDPASINWGEVVVALGWYSEHVLFDIREHCVKMMASLRQRKVVSVREKLSPCLPCR